MIEWNGTLLVQLERRWRVEAGSQLPDTRRAKRAPTGFPADLRQLD
jgi:hypothetical protein